MAGIITGVAGTIPFDVVYKVGQMGQWLQALGIVIVITIVFQVITFFLNRRRLKEIEVIKKDMARIEGKIDSLISNNVKKRRR